LRVKESSLGDGITWKQGTSTENIFLRIGTGVLTLLEKGRKFFSRKNAFLLVLVIKKVFEATRWGDAAMQQGLPGTSLLFFCKNPMLIELFMF